MRHELAEPRHAVLSGTRRAGWLPTAAASLARARSHAFKGISAWLHRLDRFAQVVERTKGAP
jgi:hypothetical protein